MTRPEFPATLTNITGIEKIGDLVKIINGAPIGNVLFLNSGIGNFKDLSGDEIQFENIGDFAGNYFRQGPRFTYTRLHLPPKTLLQNPHCHPGGEIAIVREGEYFDADMGGNRLHTYGQGSVIFYTKGSTHRPLSVGGASIDYITFDGIVMGDNTKTLIAKMEKIPKIDEQAIAFAELWMNSTTQ